MSLGGELGVQQFAVYRQLKPAAVRRHQPNRLDFWFEFVQQFNHQTGGALGIVSDSTVFKLDVEQHTCLPAGIFIISDDQASNLNAQALSFSYT
jgi:hypothetical protein